MTAPDAREWYSLDMAGAATHQANEAFAKFRAAHPAPTFFRFTTLGIDRREPWLCIDGWLTPPDDQGPEPTDADIPTGVV